MNYGGENEVYLRRAALEERARVRARGIQGRTRVRAAGNLGAEARCFHITEATFLDEDSPDADYSALTYLSARIFDHNVGYGERKIALKFPQPVVARGPFHIGCTASAACSVNVWVPSFGGSDVQTGCFAFGWPITSFNGLTVSTLNWNNRGSLTYGSNIGATQIAQCMADGVSGTLSTLASGYANGSFAPQPIDCALRFNCGGGVAMEGLLIELGLQWTNVWYGGGGSISGGLEIDRSDSDNVWSFFAFYNPT